MIINIGFLGDIVGRSGRTFVMENIETIKKNNKLDVIIANGENASGGTGLGKKEAIALKNAGIDLITLGDHAFSNQSTLGFLNSKENDFCVAPLNFSKKNTTRDFVSFKFNDFNIVVFSLLGKTFMTQDVISPFDVVEDTIKKIKIEYKENAIIILDFHAEATSEKQAMSYFLDGKISAILGTHTHVQTNDCKILKNGTCYITDAGMCGPVDGVIGMDYQYSLDRLTGKREKGYKLAEGKSMINGVTFSFDTENSCVVSIQNFQIFEK